jgi:Mn2+/Fe2+ NRAMP family transporter
LLLLAVFGGGRGRGNRSPGTPADRGPEEAPAQIGRIRADTYVGMGYSNLISLFIIITTAATVNAHWVTDIQTSSQAAEALRPIAGEFTFAVFAAGIIGISQT